MNLIRRFKGIFTNPDETFGEIKESPDFKGLLVNFLIVLLECIMIAAILMSKITITDHPQFSYILFIVILITLIIGFLLVYVVDTIIIWIIGKIFKGSGSLKQTASAFGYVCIFQVIYYVGVLISALSFNPVSIKISNAIFYQQMFTILFGSLIMLIFSIILAILFTIYVYFISRDIHELNKIRAIIIVVIFIIISLVFEIF
jgi:hypothetical protein